MTNNEKKYFIYQDNQKFEVNKNTYQAYYRPIWNTFKNKQRHGECALADWRQCQGDCGSCRYIREGNSVSLDAPRSKNDRDNYTLRDYIEDPSPSAQTILENKELLSSLYSSLNALEQYEKHICELYMLGLSEREIATELNIPRSTFKYRWKKILEKLSENLKNFL